jgi:hypothetical protein
MAIALESIAGGIVTSTVPDTSLTRTISTGVAGCLLIATAYFDTSMVGVSGGGLTWNLLQTGTKFKIFWAWAAGTLSSQVITADLGGSNVSFVAFEVHAWSGSQNRTPAVTTNTAAMSASYSAVGTGSQLDARGYTNSSTAAAYQAGNTGLNTGILVSPAEDFWGCYYSASLTTAGNSYTVGQSIAGGGSKSLVIIEIYDAAYAPSGATSLLQYGIGI